jgi:K+-sensing histidine kinase KdpD
MLKRARGNVAETHFRRIFDNSPIPTYEQDYGDVASLLERHRRAGVVDIVEHLEHHPADLDELTSVVKVRIANRAAVDTFAYDPADHGNRVPFASEGSKRSFLQQVAAVWHGRSEMRYEFTRDPATAGPTNCALHWSVPETPEGPDWAHVVISIADVAERHGLDMQVQQQTDQLTLLHDINRGISSNLDAADLLRTITAGVSRVLEAAWVEMLLLDESLETVIERIAVGLEDGMPGITEIHDGIVGWVLRHGSATISPDITTDPRTQGVARAPTVGGSVVIAPLTAEGRTRGTLAAGLNEGAKVFAQSDLEIVELMAAHASFAIQNARSLDVIETQISARDRLVASVAHELRTPLGNASGLASELADNWDDMEPAERRKLVDLIAQESIDASQIVEDLLVSARADLGQLPLLRQPIDLEAQARFAVESLGESGAGPISISGEGSIVVADPVRVRQILRNLITNALRYGGDTIAVRLLADITTGRVQVIDNGPGVEAGLERALFTDFARGSAPAQESLGLGLSISRQLAGLMDGELTYRREAGTSIFELALPLG